MLSDSFLNVSSFQSIAFFLYLPPEWVISFGNLCFTRKLDISFKFLNYFIRYPEAETVCLSVCLVLLLFSFLILREGLTVNFRLASWFCLSLHGLGIKRQAQPYLACVLPLLLDYLVLYFLKS